MEDKAYFPEDKDLAHKIMLQLPNEDLIKLCASNKRLHDLCYNYPDFWRNKFVLDYGEEVAKYKPEDRSWKNHYMQVFIDLQLFRGQEIRFFDNIIWKENLEGSFYVEENLNKRKKTKKDVRILIPLKNAPEKILTNLYLLKIPKVEIDKNISKNIGDIWYSLSPVFENTTPIELLRAIYTKKKIDDNGFPPFPSDFPAYIYGFRYGEKTVRRKNFRGKIWDKNRWILNEYDNYLDPNNLPIRPTNIRKD